ncbi:MAG: sulfatase-like hydrolase/transferase [Anaerolineae bacterium]|nr:sulfatase-like hydrolase/transferase [Anaerolineae bacterium]
MGNVLIIHADRYRCDCLGAYGNPDIRTPNMDALAADGVLYHNSFCPFPVCTPSRYSFLSGLYVHQHLGWSTRSTCCFATKAYNRSSLIWNAIHLNCTTALMTQHIRLR